MALTAGSRLGPYGIVSPLGAGGMGEVYRATDTKLKRQVAIKILSESLATDPDRLARFQREAEVLASLNHPNIAHIHGLEEADGVKALVMELVEGPTLADRIAQGPVPLDEALPIARQIAEALEGAHEQGIVHRNLKPGNIKVRDDGTVKVLDFGLAKLADPIAGGRQSNPSVTASPTITSPALMTGVGVLLGTAAYMAPEQARGKTVDKRTDIWAFGCVLYEMLTGRRAFGGDDVTETLASIITREPDWRALPSGVPSSTGRLLRRCLQKDPRQRLHDIADARIEIEEGRSTSSSEAGNFSTVGRSKLRRLVFPGAMLLAGAAISGGLILFTVSPRAIGEPVTRLEITTTGDGALSMSGFDPDIAITPNGADVVYIGNNGTKLFVRPLNALEPTLLTKGELRHPFISPDGQWVAYFENGQTLRKIALNGGPPATIVRSATAVRGAVWSPDGSIIFANLNPDTGLQRVSASGGGITVLTRPDRVHGEQNHWWPEVLPNGRGVLFTIISQSGGLDAAEVAVLDLRTGSWKVLVRGGSRAHYVPGGYLTYGAAGTLRAIRFDLGSFTTAGQSIEVVRQVMSTPFGAVEAAVSSGGTLLYVPGGFAARGTRALSWVDRQGRKTHVPMPERTYAYPRLSPDGNRILVVSPEQDYDLWLWDLRHAALTRATFAVGQDSFPTWTPDGRQIVYTSARDGAQNIYEQAADGTGAISQLTAGDKGRLVSSISPDGSRVLFATNDPITGFDIMALTLDSGRQVIPLLRTPANERNAEVSPNGRWLAYQSDESGQFEIYVRPFPAVNDGRWQISTAGGTRPLWSRDGRELFYLSPSDNALMAVTIESTTSWGASAPAKLLDRPAPYFATYGGRTYDVSVDGQRFLMPDYSGSVDVGATSPSLVVVQHWAEELSRLVPAAGK